VREGWTRPERVPRGWDCRRLGEVADVAAGGRLGLTKSDYLREGVPAYSAAGQDGFVLVREYRDRAAVILSSIGAHCGKCFLASGDFTTLANTQAIFPRPGLDAEFLYHQVNSSLFWPRVGSAHPFIRPRDIRSCWVFVPPPAEQRSFCRKLSLLGAAEEASERLLQKLSQIQADWAGQLWQSDEPRKPLSETSSLRMGEVLIASDCTGTGIPIYSADSGSRPWRHSTHPRLRLRPGAIVIGARGTLGNPRLPSHPVFTSTQTTIVLQPGPRLLPGYIWFLLRYFDFTSIGAQQAVPMLTVSALSSLLMPLPTLDVQKKVWESAKLLLRRVRDERAILRKYSILRRDEAAWIGSVSE
jgi:hypothetical protein